MTWITTITRLGGCRPSRNLLISKGYRIGPNARASHTFVLYAPDCNDPDALSRRLSVRGSHMAKAKEDVGRFVIRGGAMLAPDSDLDVVAAGGPKKMIGSVIFVRGNSLDEVTKRVKEDIYYTSGVRAPDNTVRVSDGHYNVSPSIFTYITLALTIGCTKVNSNSGETNR
ncbi:YCII-related domain, partial [Rhizoctonia solani]